MKEKELITILDFGSQYSQLIARRIRECGVFSQLLHYNTTAEEIKRLSPIGIILSGGPASVYSKNAPCCDKNIFKLGIPILGICYGFQLIVHLLGGKVERSKSREYGRTELTADTNNLFFHGLPTKNIVWMSHGDKVLSLPQNFKSIATTNNTEFAAAENSNLKIIGIQFHPQVVHTPNGIDMLRNFCIKICAASANWTMTSFIEKSLKEIKEKVEDKNVILGLSGGVDSSVAAVLIHKAIGNQLKPIFVNNGLLRKNEEKRVIELFSKNMQMPLRYVNATNLFLKKLKGVSSPEKKRKIIGREFVNIFNKEAKKIKNAGFLAQGTTYPDVIESIPIAGNPSAMIKSHHNVGGLPKKMKLKLLEPLAKLFKDEVREVGKQLGLPDEIILRQPFPGPGLGVRIIGEIKKEYLEILKNADSIVVEEMKKADLYYKTWQTFAVLLPIKTVGVMGDERTYDNVVALRAVDSIDGMTADWVRLPYELLAKIANRIINEVDGVNRVVYDITSKPPGTIEWE
ncbi:MAG TPA: glutamine-hydrolyzing GMP synthase [Victivallales bacterium]|nr:glutamine-hydrolyzing GMP synthase [Victivallales bacterium]